MSLSLDSPSSRTRSRSALASTLTSPGSAPRTPDWMAPLSRELENVIAERNLLTCRTRRRVLQDLHDTAASGEGREMARLRTRAVQELIDSEKSYLRHLELVQDYFLTPLREKAFLPQQEFVLLQGDLPSIMQVNRELLSSLETSTEEIGKVFLELAPYLKFYSTYAQDFQTSAKLVERWTEKHKAFRAFVSAQETRPEVQLKLNALLITPVQRIPRYKMLLEDVIKNTPECHPDKANLRKALTEIDAVAWHINDQLREHQDSLKMIDIQKSLVGGFPKIIIPGRKLLKQGNLMKVPRAGGSAKPRYFVLFTDMIMYCKIRASGVGALQLPKTNALECGCMMPLKHTRVETLVGKGVFKLTCQKQELILYSASNVDESERSDAWVDAIATAVEQRKKDAATLRKESSRRQPMMRPELLKMRRESLSQIMLNNTKHKMVLRERKGEGESPSSTPTSSSTTNRTPTSQSARRKKRQAPATPRSEVAEESPSKLTKVDPQATPTGRRQAPRRGHEEEEEGATPTKMMPPPPPPQFSGSSVASAGGSSVQLRKKKAQRPGWKTLSLTRREKIVKEETSSPHSLYRSPSIYDNDSADADADADATDATNRSRKGGDVMTSYLSGKLVPLTPSQKQTDVSHLVQQELKEKIDGSARKRLEDEFENEENNANSNNGAVVPATLFQPNKSFCVVM